MTSSQMLRMPERHSGRALSMRFVPGQHAPARGDAPPAGAFPQAISVAAYYSAEGRGFAPGHELEDWIKAERQVRATYQDADDSGH